jgi:hypothetical protein
MKYRKSLFVFLVLLLACTLPVMAVNTYVGGSPKMSAAISGTNEFNPGYDGYITVVIQNSGVYDDKTVYNLYGTINPDDLPTTAKMVTVGLAPGTAPVIIKSDTQTVGDILTQGKVPVKISVKITTNATEGEYQLPLTIGYTYFASSNQPTGDVLQSKYNTIKETTPLTIKIKPQVKIDVIEVSAANLSVGTGGFVTLKIRNLGFEDGKSATVTLLRNGNSPIIPTESSVFIGDFPRDGVVTCRYKIGISSEAEKQIYPVDVAVTYENREGDILTSARDTIGIPVGGKVTFLATPESASVVQGSDQVIVIKYQNTGEIPVYAAQARVSAVDPFTSKDNTAYLGDLKPGETAIARYSVSSASDAEVKIYDLDTEVRYRDSLDSSQISDIIKVPVQVVAKPASSGVMQLLPALIIIALIAGGVGYYFLVYRRKNE